MDGQTDRVNYGADHGHMKEQKKEICMVKRKLRDLQIY